MRHLPGQNGNPFPTTPKPSKVVVQRNPLPQVNRMVEDAYHVLASQISRYRHLAASDELTPAQAGAFQKLVLTLASIQNLERQNSALLELGKLSPPELERLAQQANHALRSHVDGDLLPPPQSDSDR